jgi:pimeloyl-ACP methyl ester carboxylesterase
MMFSTNGASLFVEDKGGDGEPVVFQHGLGGDANQTREVFPRAADLRMITLECRCHGRSEPGDPRDYAMDLLANDLFQYIDRTFVDPVILGGISMGAAIALRLAVKWPGRVKALILARPAWLFAAAPPNLAVTAFVGRLLSENPSAEALRLFQRTEIARDLAVSSPDNMASILRYFKRKDASTFANMLRTIAADGPEVSEAEVAGIKVPTLVIGTADDQIHPLTYAHELAATIPSAVFREITSKSKSRPDYVAQFKDAVSVFCREVSEHNERGQRSLGA